MTFFKMIKLLIAVRKIKSNVEDVGMGKIKSGLASTEFWVSVICAALIAANRHLGLNISDETITNIITLVITYVAGRSGVKVAGAIKGNK